MRRTRHSLVLLCAALLASIPMQIRAQTIGTVLTDDPARVIVKLKADSSLLREQVLSATAQEIGRAQALGQRLGLAMSAGSMVSDRIQVVFASGITSAELAQRLALESDVEYAVPDQRRTILWHLMIRCMPTEWEAMAPPSGSGTCGHPRAQCSRRSTSSLPGALRPAVQASWWRCSIPVCVSITRTCWPLRPAAICCRVTT